MKGEFPDSIIDEEAYSRFDQRDTVFGKIHEDRDAPFYHQSMYDQIDQVIDRKKGYSSFHLARALGGWSVYDYFTEAFRVRRPNDSNNIMNKPVLNPPEDDPNTMTRELKLSALTYGAGAVGITEVDPRWVYSADRDGNPLEDHLSYDYAVVMIVPMDSEMIQTSPKLPAATASAISYSRMAFLISCLAEYIRRLGFEALPMGNNGGLSIPLAVDAGLGRLGRNGLLINSDLGSCLKICKVFTNMNLVEDEPLTPPLSESCRTCTLCSEACEVDAISEKPAPTNEVACPSNNKGIKRWPVDHYSCYQFWIENGSDCSSCVAACPHTPQTTRK
ncbi:hypothetical protein K9M78_06955 [Candidatus Bipolaricaulota bacterium]|nr:hypothetical protein [Candidatus Bipolaricaulota bacterium]